MEGRWIGEAQRVGHLANRSTRSRQRLPGQITANPVEKLLVADTAVAQSPAKGPTTQTECASLARLPEGSLGRVYLAYMIREGISRLARLRSERQMPGSHALVELARQRGKRSARLVTADWAQLLALPIDEVRDRLGIGPPPRYTRYVKNPLGSGVVPEQLAI